MEVPSSFVRQASRRQSLQKMPSMDEHMRKLVPDKVGDDDKLIEYDALLLDSFMDILQDLNGDEIRDKVHACFELASECENGPSHGINNDKLDELGEVLLSLDPGDAIVVASSFSHMLNLTNLAEEVQIAFRRRVKLKKREFGDENSAITESDLEETFKTLVNDLKKTPLEIFEALKSQTVDLVLTAHPTQSIRRSLLQKHGR